MNETPDWKELARKWEVLATEALFDAQDWKRRARERREGLDLAQSKIIELQFELGRAEALLKRALRADDAGESFSEDLSRTIRAVVAG